jgi:hypothetical protein
LEGLDDAKMAAIRAAACECAGRRALAQRLSVDEFRSPGFTQTGSEEWMQFLRAAKTLASAEQTADGPYPRDDSACLLCGQPLSATARDLLARLWAFLEGTAQAQLQEAQQTLGSQLAALTRVDLGFFEEQAVCCRYLSEHDPELAAAIRSFVLACCQRRDTVQRDPNAPGIEALPYLPHSGIREVKQLIVSLQARREALLSRDTTQEIAEREKEQTELEHRRILAQHFAPIEAYVRQLAWASKAAKLGGTTRHITAKHGELFKQLVTDRYVELFQERLRDLGRPLSVRIGTVGRKSRTLKQIVLSSASATAKVGVDHVLSEGEKRAVALADFLTEVALDTASSGIILDDPVTSLDLQWRETIAALLVSEATRRQVIVFTHDLPFLYFLTRDAGSQGTAIATHWIKRGGSDGQPGYVFLDNCPALEKQYRKPAKAEELLARAKAAASAKEQEELLQQGFGALRSTYEAFIVFDLLGEVVMRFDERISFGRLKDIVWDAGLANEVIGKCELLSRYIDGHLHSDNFALKPSAIMLQHEISEFHGIRKRLGQMRKLND